MAEDISGKILQAVKYGIQSSLKTLPVDKTYVGTVIEVLGTKQYLVKYDDAERKISTTNEIGLSVGDVVHITYPQNDASKKYIKEDVASGSGGSTVSGVSSVDGLTGVVVLKNKYASKASEHTHNNKTVLDKLSESNGTLMYNGSEISGGGSSGSGENDSFIIDFGNFSDNTTAITTFDCGTFS